MKNNTAQESKVVSDKHIFWIHDNQLYTGGIDEFNSFLSRNKFDIKMIRGFSQLAPDPKPAKVEPKPKKAKHKYKKHINWADTFGESLYSMVRKGIDMGQGKAEILENLFRIADKDTKLDIMSRKRLRKLLSIGVAVSYMIFQKKARGE